MGRGLGVKSPRRCWIPHRHANLHMLRHLALHQRRRPWTDQLLDAEAHRTIPAPGATLAAATFSIA